MIPPFICKFDRARYSDSWLALQIPESNIEKNILEKLRWKGILAVKTDTGAKTLRGRAVGLAKRLGGSKEDLAVMNAGRTAAGVKGLPDVVGILPGGRSIMLEIKAPLWLARSPKTGKLVVKRQAGEPSDEQIDFLTRAHRQGAIVGVVWAPEDLDRILAENGL